MTSKRKLALWEIYSLVMGTGLLLVLGANELNKNKLNPLEQLIDATQVDTSTTQIPQANNYEEIGPIKYNMGDPMQNVYRIMGIEPNNCTTPEQLDSAVRKKYNPNNKFLNK